MLYLYLVNGFYKATFFSWAVPSRLRGHPGMRFLDPDLPGSQNVERPLPPDPTPSRALPTW